MKTAKEYYRNYQADNNWSQLSADVIRLILSKYGQVNHVLEFGSGSGKHLRKLDSNEIVACGLDISITNLLNSHFNNENKFLILGDESHLRHLCNFDICLTVSVLDHIQHIEEIVRELKRIANKAVILAEATRHDPDNYYWNHNYEKLGFEALNYKWESDSDGATYLIWVWKKGQPIKGAIDPELITM